MQREAKDDARRAIAAFCFTEDDIRQKLAQEEQWDEFSDNAQEEAIEQLMDAWEYEEASKVADHSTAEAIARFLHDKSIKQSIPDESLGDSR